MGKNARIRKLRRELLQRAATDPGKAALLQRQNSKAVLMVASPEHERMSDTIEEFAEPLLEGAHDLGEVSKALCFAILLWNVALAPEAEREIPDELTDLLADPVVEKAFRLMMARKATLFPDNKRMILDYDIRETEAGISFNVVSTLG